MDEQTPDESLTDAEQDETIDDAIRVLERNLAYPKTRRAADFIDLVSASSLGTQEAMDDRLAGRREISAFEAEYPNHAANLTASMSDPDRIAEHAFDLDVADELERRDRTFEAELRYRAIASSMHSVLADAQTSAATRDLMRRAAMGLALLLDAKGFGEEALRLYACASQANDPNAAWRLAVVSEQVGRPDWAKEFAQLANCSMTDRDREDLTAALQQISKNRDKLEIGGVIDSPEFEKHSVDATYALGSALVVMSGRIDLARLAYCSALSRGHSLAAVSLLDLPGRGTEYERAAQTVLREVLESNLRPRIREACNARSLRVEPFMMALRKEQKRPTVILSRKNQAKRKRHVARSDMQGVLLLARTVTTLRGYVGIGYDAWSRQIIRDLNNRVSREMRKIIPKMKDDDPPLARIIWAVGDDELEKAKKMNRRARGRVPVFEDADVPPYVGTVSRMGNAFADLSAEHLKVLALRLSGASEADVADVLRYAPYPDPIKRVRVVFFDASARLRKGQRGEQFDPQLWKAVESSFDDIPDDVKAHFEGLREMEEICK
jgi:hypothetical protein